MKENSNSKILLEEDNFNDSFFETIESNNLLNRIEFKITKRTLLHKISRSNKVENLVSKLQILIESKIDVNKKDKKGKTALFYFCDNKNVLFEEEIKFLINSKSDINCTDKNKNSVLHLVLQKRNRTVELIDFLLKKGVNLNQKNKFFKVALFYEIERIEYSKNIVSHLIDNKADINIINNISFRNSMDLLLEKKNLDSIFYEKLVENFNFPIEIRYIFKQIPTKNSYFLPYFRFEDFNIDTVKKLIRHGLDLYSSNYLYEYLENCCFDMEIFKSLIGLKFNYTKKELIYQVFYKIEDLKENSFQIFKFLIEYDEENFTKSIYKDMILCLLELYSRNQENVIFLILEYILQKTYLDLGIVSNIRHPILVSIMKRSFKVQKLIYQHICFPMKIDSFGNLMKEEGILEKNLNYKYPFVKTSINIFSNIKFERNENLFHFLAQNENIEIDSIKCLLSFSLDINLVNSNNKTPLDYLIDQNPLDLNVLEFMIPSKANPISLVGKKYSSVQFIIEKKLFVTDYINPKNGNNDLHEVCSSLYTDIDLFNILLKYSPHLIHHKNKNLQTPLFISIKKQGFSNFSKILIECKSDINSKDIDFLSPLHYAIKYKRFEIFNLLSQNNSNKEGMLTFLHQMNCPKEYVLPFLKEIAPIHSQFLIENTFTTNNFFGENNIDINTFTLSLICPLSLTRIVIPVRDPQICKHLDCFDFYSFMHMKGKKCPVCHKEVKEIQFDVFVNNILLKTDPNNESVSFSKNSPHTWVAQNKRNAENEKNTENKKRKIIIID